MGLVKLGAMVAAAGLSLAACGSSGPAASSTSSSTTATASTTVVTTTAPATTAGSSTSPPTTAPATTAGTPLCTPAVLQASFTVIPGSQGAGNEVARVVLTNAGSSACKTYGYVGMQLLGADGSLLPTNVVRIPVSSYPTITLTPGASASASARFSPDIPGPGESETGPCEPTATRTEITPPDNTAHLVVDGPGTSVCEHGTMNLSPLQAGNTAGE